MATHTDVITAVATPPGEGAIGILRLSGTDCVKVASSFLRWHHRGLTPRTATLAPAYADGRLLDKVLVTFFPGPNSYTGEDLIEISAHGSPYILSSLLSQACRQGARIADPGEFSQRAFLNGRIDLAQAEAVGSLIRAKTRLAHRAALEQLEGGLSAKVRQLQKDLVEFLAEVEAGLDHPDEDIPELNQTDLGGNLSRLRAELEKLIATYRTGKIAVEGARIAIVGSPNVGKSSLLNQLLGKNRAIVTDIPGTTRDTLEEAADLNGLTAIIIDTAGLRHDSVDSVEKIGMERTRKAMDTADLILFVIDRSRPLTENEQELLKEADEVSSMDSKRPVIAALNKSDLPFGTDLEKLPASWIRAEVSALTGSGIVGLIGTISETLAGEIQDSDKTVLLTSLRHRQALEETLRAIGQAEASTSDGELAALALREALKGLGEVIGATTSEDVLKTIFSKFCIGK